MMSSPGVESAFRLAVSGNPQTLTARNFRSPFLAKEFYRGFSMRMIRRWRKSRKLGRRRTEGGTKARPMVRSPNFAGCARNEVPLRRKDPLNYRTVVI